jgi:chromosome segregation protein
VERAAALQTEGRRLEEAAVELERRAAALTGELQQNDGRVATLRAAIAAAEAELDSETATLDALQQDVRAADESVAALRARADAREALVKQHRAALDSMRGVVSDLAIALATADSDLSHLSASCYEAVQASLDDVIAEVEEAEREGSATPGSHGMSADENEDSGAGDPAQHPDDPEALLLSEPDLSDPGAAVVAAERQSLGAEEAIAALREKIDRLGPVNMMAIEQFEELETRHAFLSTQQKDLVAAIGQTSEAIKRIDQTTRQRFADAFAAINQNFQNTFGTLFGGGRAGLTLLDENDPLESGIEIIAQPPGKRLQSVQLLSGGEKALTAIALMFGLFQYKPSPFCLLDEIDAPLDDANIGRFVDMLRGMQSHTQFILITHNRKTMEIADRLYGVTMEEPGVSKLISVNLN